MSTVKQILYVKGDDVISIEPQMPVLDAIKIMADNEIGAVLVLDDKSFVGILTERCYAREIILKGKSSHSTAVSEIMMTGTPHAHPNSTVQECMELMTKKFIRHLPVVVDNEVIGVISIGDLVKAIIDEQQSTIEDLERYIAG